MLDCCIVNVAHTQDDNRNKLRIKKNPKIEYTMLVDVHIYYVVYDKRAIVKNLNEMYLVLCVTHLQY